MKLFEWEKILEDQFKQIELIGELDISESDIQDLASGLRACIERYGHKKGLDTLLKNFPCTWMTFLVFQGVYGYSEGDFWSSTAEAVGIENRQALSVWGRLFCQLLERFDLPIFPNQEGHRYVTRVLLHGGIPLSELSRFFDVFLARAISDPGLNELEPGDLIGRLLEIRSVYDGLAKPARRFLEAGGQIAEDFVSRCLELAVVHAETGRAPSAIEIGVPERVVQAYSIWKNSNTVNAYRSRHHLQRPHILLDAYGDGVVIQLPGQSLPDPNTSPEVRWIVNLDDTMLSQSVRSYRRRDGWQTEEDWVILSRPFSECRIRIDDGRALGQSWRVGGIDSKMPLLLFDGESRRLLAWKNRVAAGHYWLVYPQTFSLAIDDGRLLEDADRLAWDWGNYRAERWDLAQAKQICLIPISQRADIDKPIVIPVAPDQSALRPQLDGGNIVPWVRTGIGTGDVYSKYPPTICIPVSVQRLAGDEVGRWTVALTKMSSRERSQYALADLEEGVSIEDRLIRLDLIKAKLLDKNHFGVFEIALRGPLGRDTSFTIVCIPDLLVDGSTRVRVARPGYPDPVSQLQIRCADWLAVDTVGSEIVVSPIAPGHFSVVMPSNIFQAELRILLARHQAEINVEEVFIRVAAPILRWAIVEGQGVISTGDWRTLPLHQPIAWLEQAERPQLVVSVAPTTFHPSPLSGYLSVIYGSSGYSQIVQADAVAKRLLRFELRELLDSVRTSSLAQVGCMLELDSLGDYLESVSVPVLYLSQSLDIDQMELDAELNLNQWTLTLRWDSSRALGNRQVTLWSLSRPWIDPVTCPIPDSAQSSFTWSMPTFELVPGNYRVQMSIMDPWVTEEANRPSRYSPNCIDKGIGSPIEQSVYMAGLPDTVSGYLERALILSGSSRSAALVDMADRFETWDIPFVLDFLLHMIREEGVDELFGPQDRAEIDVLSSLLMHPPHILYQEIAERLPIIGNEQQGELKVLLIVLGACSHPANSHHWHKMTADEMERLWSLWPVLGVMLESHALVTGDMATWHRADARLGLSTLIPDLQIEESEADVGCKLPELRVFRELCGGAPEENLLRMSASALECIRDELHIIPSGLLAENQWLSANLAWLLACKKSPELGAKASQWLKNHVEWLVDSVQVLKEENLVSPEILKLVSQRYTRRDHNTLVYLPYACGATALILRILAHEFRAREILRNVDSELELMAAHLMTFAPRLFERDLCLIELMLVQLRFGGIDHDNPQSD